MKGIILLLGLSAALAEILGGVLLTLRKSWPKRLQEIFLALGAGFLLALVFVKLIPTSIHLVGEVSALYIVIGFATMHFFEHTVVGHLHFGQEVHTDAMVSKFAGLSALSGLLVHAFVDGLAISVGMQINPLFGLLIFFGVLLHKFPEGLTLGSIMMAAGFSRKTIFLSSLSIGAATLLGTSTVFLFSAVNEELTAIAFAFSAGAAVYVGASDLIPEINKSESRIPPLVVFGGMLLYYVSDKLLTGIL